MVGWARCPAGHLLVRETAHLGVELECDGGCRRTISPGEPRMSCGDCDFDVCFGCANGTTSRREGHRSTASPQAQRHPPSQTPAPALDPAQTQPQLHSRPPPEVSQQRELSALRWSVLHYVSATSHATCGKSLPAVRKGSQWSGKLAGERCQLIVSHRDGSLLEGVCVWATQHVGGHGSATLLEGQVNEREV